MTLDVVLRAAAAGRPPEPDGTVEVLPQHGLAAAVVAFSAHFLVCADVDPDWVVGVLPPGDYSAPHGARFLTALADRIGSDIGALDVVLAQPSDPAGDAGLALQEIEARDHPRVVRALRYREDVRVWRTPDGDGPRADRSRTGRALGDGLRGRAVRPRGRSRPAARAGSDAPRPVRRGGLGAGLPRPSGVTARGARGRLPPGLRRGAAAACRRP